MKDNQQEIFPIVDEEGTVVGKNILTPNFESEFKRFFPEKIKGDITD